MLFCRCRKASPKTLGEFDTTGKLHISNFNQIYVVYYCLKKEEISETFHGNKNCVDFDYFLNYQIYYKILQYLILISAIYLLSKVGKNKGNGPYLHTSMLNSIGSL